jgi:hypothetical protein
MRTEIRTKLEKIKKVSSVLQGLCKGLMVLISLLGVSCILCLGFGVGGINVDGRLFRTGEMPPAQRIAIGVATAIALVMLLKCFHHLDRLFGNYSRGEIFTQGSVRQLRQFGIACVLWGLASFGWTLLLAISAHAPQPIPGHLDSLGIGGIIILIAWLMDMAVDAHEENELTI